MRKSSMRTESKLNDLNVVFFESRLAKTLGDLIRLQGGNPISAPSMKETPLENNPAAFAFAEKLFSGKVDVLILLTGVGTRALLAILETRYSREEILSALKKITLMPRGPKPIRVLNELNLPYAFTVPEPNTWREILSCLDEHAKDVPIKGRQVFVQEYGVTNSQLLEGLKKRDANVTRVPVYRWELPDDLEPLKNSIRQMIEGKMQVAVFTTAVQIDHLLKVARFLGVESDLKGSFKQMAVASVGPDCTQALRGKGIEVDIQPASPKMGPLVTETAEKAKQILAAKNSKDCADEVFDAVISLASEEPDQNTPLYEQSVFMKACRLEKTPYTPVWLMRQAGRYMKEYRKIRDSVPFLEICKNKDLVTEITVVAQEKLKADAAIIFSDILLLVESFGLGLEYLKGDGPSIKRPIASAKEVDSLPEIHAEVSLGFVYQAIRQTRNALDSSVPLIGFAGAPFTLASYMIEGGASKDFQKTKKFMTGDAGAWKTLMEKIVRATTEHLNEQIKAGAQAVQVFDSWVGQLSSEEYEKYVLPYSSKLIKGLTQGTPVIHFGTGTGNFIEKFSEAGGSIIGIDHHINLDDAWKRIGSKKGIQGNLDPKILCSDLVTIRKHAEKILKFAEGRTGHIFNLGHGVLPEAPVENAVALVEMVHEISTK